MAGLSEWDKLGVALGLSLDPMRESIARAVEETLAPQLFYGVGHGVQRGGLVPQVAGLLQEREHLLPEEERAGDVPRWARSRPWL